MNKTNKTTQNTNVKEDKKVEKQPVSNPLDGPMGLIMVFVIVSIAYSTYIVFFGTTGLIPKLMLVPQALFAALVMLYKFAR